MSANTIRTTVAFDRNLHTQLMTQAVQMGVGFSSLLNLKLTNKNFGQAVLAETPVRNVQ